ncbi:MAG: ribulose-phosphate 3-epimerase [Bacteroides sp. CAG:1060_57_27]|nr:MAG: ribulose-phosphate 3-epimerase [Bacteroides sp. CAG:1060_57_27]
MFRIAPSILAADFLHLERDLESVNRSGDILHLDVMDGSLVPNISFGFSVIDQLAPVVTRPMDVHLMVVEPQRWFEKVAADGVSLCSFHLEAAGESTSEYIARIHALGMKAGVVINPDIPVERLFPYIGEADYFLLMSVFAGFGGQKFIPESLGRARILRAEIDRRGADALIEMDGGINMSTVSSVREAGVDIAVAGSAVFKAEDPVAAVRALRGE